MKLLIFAVLFVFSFTFAAQVPVLIPLEGIARNGDGEPLVNMKMTARFSIRAVSLSSVVWLDGRLINSILTKLGLEA
jgi:hypothetical protein